MIINDSAIFIADSHYNDERTILFDLLNKIKNNEIQTTQIFLMGDIFDFLASEIEYFEFINYKITSLINDLSRNIEIIYFEGNHDFNLESLFPDINVISRSNQPYTFNFDNKDISLSHGDIYTPLGYDIYTYIFRNIYFIKLLNFLDINSFISKYSEKKLKKKEICHKQNNFDNFKEKRIKNYNVDLVIEGHFHQGYLSENYINLPSLCCSGEFMIYKDKKFSFVSLL